MSDPAFVEIFREELLSLEKEFNYCQTLACMTKRLVGHMHNMEKLLDIASTNNVMPRKAWQLGVELYKRVVKFTIYLAGQVGVAQLN